MSDIQIFDELQTLLTGGQTGVLCTVTRARGSVPRRVGSRMLVYPDGHFSGTIGGGEMESRILAAAAQAHTDGKAQIVEVALIDPASGDPGVCGGKVEIFVEPIQPEPVVLVIGGGHVGRAIVHLAHWAGFRVALHDDRPEFCNADWAPGADAYYPLSAAEMVGQFTFSHQTYIVMPTRAVPVDVEAIPLLLAQPHAYLGVIGSRRRWAAAQKIMIEQGVSAEQLAQIDSPMGLELNAETPEEIAVSIIAELIQRRRGGHGGSMKQAADKIEAAA